VERLRVLRTLRQTLSLTVINSTNAGKISSEIQQAETEEVSAN